MSRTGRSLRVGWTGKETKTYSPGEHGVKESPFDPPSDLILVLCVRSDYIDDKVTEVSSGVVVLDVVLRVLSIFGVRTRRWGWELRQSRG